MKRYYLSKIFQDTAGTYGIPGAWHHTAQTYRRNLATGVISVGPPANGYTGIEYQGGEIKVDPQTHAPTEKALLVLVGGIDHKPFQGNPDFVPMPDVSLDVKVSAIHTPTKLDVRSKVAVLGFDEAEIAEVWGNADGLRDVLNHYGKLNNPNFDCNDFDIDES